MTEASTPVRDSESNTQAILVDEASDLALEWLTAKGLGLKPNEDPEAPRQWNLGSGFREAGGFGGLLKSYTRDWDATGPILHQLVEQGATISRDRNDRFFVVDWTTQIQGNADREENAFGLLRAALRCFVKLQMGNEVMVPRQLVGQAHPQKEVAAASPPSTSSQTNIVKDGGFRATGVVDAIEAVVNAGVLIDSEVFVGRSSNPNFKGQVTLVYFMAPRGSPDAENAPDTVLRSVANFSPTMESVNVTGGSSGTGQVFGYPQSYERESIARYLLPILRRKHPEVLAELEEMARKKVASQSTGGPVDVWLSVRHGRLVWELRNAGEGSPDAEQGDCTFELYSSWSPDGQKIEWDCKDLFERASAPHRQRGVERPRAG